MRHRIASRLTVAVALFAFAGLAWFATGARDDLTGWQATPMAPDPGMSEAARTQPVCQSRPVGGVFGAESTPPPPLASPMHVLLQDRRTARTAAFLMTTVGYFGYCLLSPATEGAGWLGEGPLPAMTDAISIDGGAGGGLLPIRESPVWGNYALLWGRTDARVSSVRIELGGPLHEVDDDDREVIATVGGGYWLAWWTLRTDRPPRTGDNQARVITGLDAQGNAVVSLELGDHGYGSDRVWIPR